MSSWQSRANFVDAFTYQVRFCDARVAAELRDQPEITVPTRSNLTLPPPIHSNSHSHASPTALTNPRPNSPPSVSSHLQPGCNHIITEPRYIVITPNMTFVPRPSVGNVTVSMRADAKFGMEDPLVWPQEAVDEESYRWISCIPRKTHPRRHSAVWTVLSEEDMSRSLEAIRSLYVVSSSRLDPIRQCLDQLEEDIAQYEEQYATLGHLHFHSLRQLQLAAEDAFDRLSLSATKRDLRQQFVAVERYFCMTVAWLLWHERVSQVSSTHAAIQVDDNLMGSFTSSPGVAQRYFRAGIPVWILRLTADIDRTFAVCEVVALTEPLAEGVVLESGEFSSTPVYQGNAGPRQFSAICYRGSLYVDIEPVPFPTDYFPSDSSQPPTHGTPAPAGGHATSAASTSQRLTFTDHAGNKRSQPGGSSKTGLRNVAQSSHRPQPIDRSKFLDHQSNSLPSLLAPWKISLSNAQAANYPPSSQGPWGYWLPDPTMVVGSDSALRRTRYVLNWLRIRQPWYYITRSFRYRVPLFASRWRLFLDDGFSAVAKVHASKEMHRRHLLDKLDNVFGHHNIDSSNLQPMWFGRVISESEVDESICRQVAWEIAEMAFAIELLMLDATFYDARNSDPQQSSQRAQWIYQAIPAVRGLRVPFVPTAAIGLSSPNLSERGKAWEGLRMLMLTWPQCPTALRRAKSLQRSDESLLKRAEQDITSFYVYTFVRHAGRAPILPRNLPHIRV